MHKTGAINFNVPSGASLESTAISNFGGLVISDNPLITNNTSAADMLNVYLTLENTLSTRPRVECIKKLLVKQMISCWKLSDNRIFYHYIDANDKVGVKIDDVTIDLNSNDIGKEKVRVFLKNNKVYVLSHLGYFVIKQDNKLYNIFYDNDNYVPITEINTVVDGTTITTKNESDNLLTNKFRRLYYWDGKSAINVPDDGTLISNEYFKSYTDEKLELPFAVFSPTSFASFHGYTLYLCNIGDEKLHLNDLTIRLGLNNTNLPEDDFVFSSDGSKLGVITGDTELSVYDLSNIDFSSTTPINPIKITTTLSFDRNDYLRQHIAIANDGSKIWCWLKNSEGKFSNHLKCFVKENNAYTLYSESKTDEVFTDQTPYTLLYRNSDGSCYAIVATSLRKYSLSGSASIEYTSENIPDWEGTLGFSEIRWGDNESVITAYDSTNNKIVIITLGDTLKKSTIGNIQMGVTGGGYSYLSDECLLYRPENVNAIYLINPKNPTSSIKIYSQTDYIDIVDCNFGILYHRNFPDLITTVFVYHTLNKPGLTYEFSKEIDYVHNYHTQTVLDGDYVSQENHSKIILYESNKIIKIEQTITYIDNTDQEKTESRTWKMKEYPIVNDILFHNRIDDLSSFYGITAYSFDIYFKKGQLFFEPYKKGTLVDNPPPITITIKITEDDRHISTEFQPTMYHQFYNNYWLVSGNTLYNTENNDPTYIPVDNKSVIGDDTDITGINGLTDSSFVVYKKDKQYVISLSTSNNQTLFLKTEMKSQKGNLPVGESIVTGYNEKPLQFTDSGIYVLSIPKNVTTDTNSAVSISEAIDPRYLGEPNKQNIITHNHLYWTYVIFPGEKSKVYVLDNRTNGWYYWELPINILSCWETEHRYAKVLDIPERPQDPLAFGETIGMEDEDTDWKFELRKQIDGTDEYQVEKFYKGKPGLKYDVKQFTETVVMTTTGETYELKTVDYFERRNPAQEYSEYGDLLYNGVNLTTGKLKPLEKKTIPWLWESQIMPLSYTKYSKTYTALGYSKQLQQTGFMFVDPDRTEEYSLHYQFIIYKKHMISRNIKDIPKGDKPEDTLNYIRSVLKRTRVPKFNFIKIRLTNTDSISHRLNLISIRFKYKLLQEQI